MTKDVIILSKEKIRGGLLSELRKVSPSAFAVYLIIHASSEDDKTSSISMREIGKLTGLTVPSVHKTIQRMIANDVIQVEKRGNKAFLYKIFS